MVTQKSIIGIVGGLGPYAHLALEEKLLKASGDLLNATKDQEFPEWILSSLPGTPDRTEAICGSGEDPTPWLVHGARLHPWSHAGYGRPVCRPIGITVSVMTPASMVAAFAAGYIPIVHPSILQSDDGVGSSS